jgi:anti-sigma factor RsiW
MPCREFEDLILDYCEGQTSPADGALAESHAAVCPDCRLYFAAHQELDSQFSHYLVPCSLSDSFLPRLASAIARERRPPQFHLLPRALDAAAYLSLAFAAGCLMEQVPHAAAWIGVAAFAASAAFALWESAKALHAVPRSLRVSVFRR